MMLDFIMVLSDWAPLDAVAVREFSGVSVVLLITAAVVYFVARLLRPAVEDLATFIRKQFYRVVYWQRKQVRVKISAFTMLVQIDHVK